MERLICLVALLLVYAPSFQAQDDQDDAELDIPWFIWLVIVVVTVFLILLICCTAYFTLYNIRVSQTCTDKPRTDIQRKHLVELQELDESILHDLSSNMDREVDRRDITLCSQLGIGEFGPIYDAEVQLRVNVTSRAVVKVFQQGTSQDLVRFREEAEEIKYLQHSNVGRVLGMVTGNSPYYLVLELTVNGDLKTFLLAASQRAPHHQGLSPGQLVALATDVAAGLSYMESRGYVHRDVAARNCMVMQNLSAKITDFKLGRFLHRSEYAVQNDGSLMPLRWMAPESIAQNRYTLKSSVWSFGVLLWEVMGRGEFPYQELGDGEVVTAVCHTRLPLPQPLQCPNTLYQEVMLSCWSHRATDRPLMEHLHQKLQSSILTNTYT